MGGAVGELHIEQVFLATDFRQKRECEEELLPVIGSSIISFNFTKIELFMSKKTLMAWKIAIKFHLRTIF
jgi:hypothetical protein